MIRGRGEWVGSRRGEELVWRFVQSTRARLAEVAGMVFHRAEETADFAALLK